MKFQKFNKPNSITARSNKPGQLLALLAIPFILVFQSGMYSAVKAQAYLNDARLQKPVLNQSSFTYIGSFTMPHAAGGADTAYSTGGLTYRYVNGNLHFLSTTHVYTGGLVYEVACPGFSTSSPATASVYHFWGDVYSGHKYVGNSGGSSDPASSTTYGIYYDQPTGQLYWNYGFWYNTTNPYNPSMGASILDDASGVASGIGAWSFNIGEKATRGGVLPIPQWFANSYTGGKRLGVGFGGYFSIISNGPDSMGPSLTAINPPGGAADQSSLPNQPILGYPFGNQDGSHGRGQRPPDYNSTYDGGQWNPAGGTGYWTWSDIIYGGGTWIDLPNAAGVLYIGKVGTGNVYYQTSDRHAQGGKYLWMVYNPKDLAAVASGAKQLWQIQPTNEWEDGGAIPMRADSSGYSGDGADMVGGICFDPSTNRLYVCVTDAADWNGSEAWSQVLAFQVTPPSGSGGGTGGGTGGGGSGGGTGGGNNGGGSGTGGGGGSGLPIGHMHPPFNHFRMFKFKPIKPPKVHPPKFKPFH